MTRRFSRSEASQSRTEAKKEAMYTAKAQISRPGLPGGLEHAILSLASVFSPAQEPYPPWTFSHMLRPQAKK